jgi:excinuclease UvrABC ATPase subunit
MHFHFNQTIAFARFTTSGRQSIAVPKKRKKATQWLRIKGATGNNRALVNVNHFIKMIQALDWRAKVMA